MSEFSFSGTPTFQQARTIYHGWSRELVELLSILISGQNPDTSTWAMNIQGLGTGGSVPVFIAEAGSGTVFSEILGADPVNQLAQTVAGVDTNANLLVTQWTPANTIPKNAAWWLKLTDGVNGPVTVTAASALKVDGSAVTQPVSIAATIPVTTTPASGSQQHVIIDQGADVDKLMLRELRRISLLLTILVGVEISDDDLSYEVQN